MTEHPTPAEIIARLAARNLRDVLFVERRGSWFLRWGDPDAPNERLIHDQGMVQAIEDAVTRTLT